VTVVTRGAFISHPDGYEGVIKKVVTQTDFMSNTFLCSFPTPLSFSSNLSILL
jgi:hypothetical protein